MTAISEHCQEKRHQHFPNILNKTIFCRKYPRKSPLCVTTAQLFNVISQTAFILFSCLCSCTAHETWNFPFLNYHYNIFTIYYTRCESVAFILIIGVNIFLFHKTNLSVCVVFYISLFCLFIHLITPQKKYEMKNHSFATSITQVTKSQNYTFYK